MTAVSTDATTPTATVPAWRAVLPVLGCATVALAAAAVLIQWRTPVPLIGIDDANIYFVYAERLLAGKGLTYADGAPPVEGFTSALWLALLLPVFAAAASPELLVALMGGVLSVGTLALVLLAVDGSMEGLEPRARRMALGFVAAWALAAPAWVGWNCLSLMESPLWGLVAVALPAAGCWCLQGGGRRATWALALACALAVVTRPEAMLLVPAVMVGGAWLAWRLGRPRRPFVLGLVAFGAALAVVTAARLAIFGVPLPNTYYAKVSPDTAYTLAEGARYLGGFVRWSPVALAGIVAAGWCVAQGAKPGDERAACRALLGLATMVLVVIPVLAGGDHFGSQRFFMAPWPLLGACVAIALRAAGERLGGKAALAAGGVLLLGVALVGGDSWPSMRKGWETLRFEAGIAAAGREGGAFLGDLTESCERRPTVGVITAGGFALAYEGPVMDLMGLNDAEMGQAQGDRRGERGHAAFSEEVFWIRPPELIVLVQWVVRQQHQMRAPWGSKAYNEFLGGLLEDARFREAYQPVFLVSRDGGPALQALARRDAIAELSGCGMQLFAREEEGPAPEQDEGGQLAPAP